MGKHRKPSPSLTNISIVVVLAGWTANFVATLVSPDYESNTQLDAMLLAVLGFLLAGRAVGDTGKIEGAEPPSNGNSEDEGTSMEGGEKND